MINNKNSVFKKCVTLSQTGMPMGASSVEMTTPEYRVMNASTAGWARKIKASVLSAAAPIVTNITARSARRFLLRFSRALTASTIPNAASRRWRHDEAFATARGS